MSPSAKARCQTQPSARSTTHVTPNKIKKGRVDVAASALPNASRCRQVPHLPRKGTSMSPSAKARCQTQPSARSTTHATPNKIKKGRVDVAASALPNASRCRQVPHLPRKGTSMSPSATPAPQSAAAPRATNDNQARHETQPSATSATPATPIASRCRQVPPVPHKKKVDVSNCHACHAKCRGAPGD